jgi:glycerol kinase
MMTAKYILAIDQGTSSTKTILFDENGQAFAKGVEPLQTQYLDNGLVEQDPEELFQNVLSSVAKCLQDFQAKGGDPVWIKACGISNQRETFLLWDESGQPLHNAIVWQCKRSIEICERWKTAGYEEVVHSSTGLLIDPYFSGSKIVWLYENNPKVKKALDSGEAHFGTVDTWLLFKLTQGKSYFTDFTNASRTLLFNLKNLSWDRTLIKKFGLSGIRLPDVKASAADFGESDFNGLLKSPVKIAAMIGDSHAAAFGEGCFTPGTAKATLGTGCSILMNIGDAPRNSRNGMVTTICWSTGSQVQYALEGVIVSCGATIEWLKNELGLFTDSDQTESMATSVADNGGVYLIPAFSGLGAPHWDMSRKASITGLSFSTNKNHIVRAALESIPYQIKDVVTAMQADTQISLNQLMVDGGISSNRFVLQFLADLIEKPVVNVGIADVSALGVAYLAGLQVKIFKDLDHLSQLNLGKKITNPGDPGKVKPAYNGWQKAIGNKKTSKSLFGIL